MNIAIEVIDQDGNPVSGASVDVFIGHTKVAGNQHTGSDGKVEFSNQTPCAGHILKFVVNKEGLETLIQTEHAKRNSMAVKLQFKPIPIPPVIPAVFGASE